MDYQMSLSRRASTFTRRSPVICSGISKSPQKHSPVSSKRWSMYDASVLYNFDQQQQQQPRTRPSSMYLPGTVSPTTYLHHTSPYPVSGPISTDSMLFSPTIAVPVSGAIGYSPTYNSYVHYHHHQQQQQQHIVYSTPQVPPQPPTNQFIYSLPSTTTFPTYDVAPMPTPGFDSTNNHSPLLSTPLTPEHAALSTPAPIVDDHDDDNDNGVNDASAAAAEEFEGEILQGMGLYDKDDADLSLEESRDSMKGLQKDCKRMLLLAEFEPEVQEEEEEEEEEEEGNNSIQVEADVLITMKQPQHQQQVVIPVYYPQAMYQVPVYGQPVYGGNCWM